MPELENYVDLMEFDTFEPTSEKSLMRKLPMISLANNFGISFSAPALEILKTEAVEFSFNAENRIIRIRAVPKDSKAAILLKKNRFYSKKLFEKYNITERGSFLAKVKPGERVLFIDLKNPK